MRKYRITLHIESVDHETPERSDVQVGMFHAESIAPLIAQASGATALFATKPTAVESHEALVKAEAESVET